MKRSQSVSQQLGGKPSSDLLGLNLFNPSSTPSSASTPTGSHPYAPLQSPPPLSLSPTPQPQPPQSAPPTHPHPRFPGEFTGVSPSHYQLIGTLSVSCQKYHVVICVLWELRLCIGNVEGFIVCRWRFVFGSRRHHSGLTSQAIRILHSDRIHHHS